MRIVITGGTGSLGHALVSQYLKTDDQHLKLIVLSRDELKQAVMRERFPDPRLEFFLGCVRDLPRLHMAFEGVDIVIHAAALKRVDATARDPDELFATNVLGSRNVLRAARGKVGRVLLISSDKACYPTNAYGASKMMSEHLFTSFNVYGAPRNTYSSVLRYGNVLGSRGSVVSIWRGQMAAGVPLTITDPTMTRFLITLPQAAVLVTLVLAMMEGGEIVVPDLPAVRLINMAQVVAPDYPTVEVGLRPGGEKCHETLLTGEELVRAVPHGDLWVVPPALAPWRTYSRYAYASAPWQPGEERVAGWGFTSDRARRMLPHEELVEMLTTVDGGT